MEFDTGETSRVILERGTQASCVRGVRLVTGNAGDHKLVHALLRAANQAPSYEDFLAGLDEPTYEPSDRLLVKRDNEIVAHARVLQRSAWFGHAKLPIGGIEDLTTLPEYCDQGYEQLLVSTAERALRYQQAVVAFARTNQSSVFHHLGWSEVGSQQFTQANVNEILGALAAIETAKVARRQRPLRIRLWRQVELEGLRKVYHQAATGGWGAIDRSEAYWRWLTGRSIHDELIVAIQGPDKWEELHTPCHIVGYAMTRGSQVVELATLPAYQHAAAALLGRACQDAIERDHRMLSLRISPADLLHQFMLAAGGTWTSDKSSHGRTLLVKLLDPTRWIECHSELLLERARVAGISRPVSIVFEIDRRKYRFELTRRSSHWLHDSGAQANAKCTPQTLGNLLLGNFDVVAANQASQIEVGDETVLAQLAALFPRTNFWQSQFDSMGT